MMKDKEFGPITEKNMKPKNTLTLMELCTNYTDGLIQMALDT